MTHSGPNMPDTKTCTKCGETKDISEFITRKRGPGAGRAEPSCRVCRNAASKSYRDKHPDYKKHLREQMRKWREKNHDHHREYQMTYTAQHREERRLRARIDRERFPQREMAHGRVRAAVDRGDLPPAWTMVCEDCQEAQSAHWHHFAGYDQENWFDIEALCTTCHGKRHRIQDSQEA